ncbi:hypothetical protein ASPVEDRAFT_41737 [Aspergillus versicolor CBS 583.65]|uniref:Shikimate dehydrogenase substrate binding N-terminal domain-containing protein n=1 Tax=Aspergillus versicolor CBS 583.65 TaxID=1036611 RepID=A0A1L9PL40_ASPVE|nr:uncharacterized protein ASPVEDRAFT_41737 [Aspergillus versicolor CBS 583.65]OJJ02244.1 hypothetical protein ASPVEDRAFT_41737 [Aspergillus versicolor CBS 583.65]
MGSVYQGENALTTSYRYGSSHVEPIPLAQPQLSTAPHVFPFGYPIAHSLAPKLHESLFKSVSLPWKYNLHETQNSSEFLPALHQPGVVGCAITMPYKISLMSAVDEVTDEGRLIGAINTVFLRRVPDNKAKVRYIGTNTDCIGIREAFLQNYPGILGQSTGKPALIIGGGGACRAAIYALWKWLGASRIYLVNRLGSEIAAIKESFDAFPEFTGELVHVSSVQQAEGLETPVLVVGTIPDYPPREEGEKLVREITKVFLGRRDKGYVLEMCYHSKPKTEFFALCVEAGWGVLYGTESMIWQGVAQQILWAELPLERFKVDEASKEISEALCSHGI